MKFLKKRGYDGTVRKIVSDDKTEVLGIVGTFKDLMELGVVEQVTNYSWDTWCCIATPPSGVISLSAGHHPRREASGPADGPPGPTSAAVSAPWWS